MPEEARPAPAVTSIRRPRAPSTTCRGTPGRVGTRPPCDPSVPDHLLLSSQPCLAGVDAPAADRLMCSSCHGRSGLSWITWLKCGRTAESDLVRSTRSADLVVPIVCGPLLPVTDRRCCSAAACVRCRRRRAAGVSAARPRLHLPVPPGPGAAVGRHRPEGAGRRPAGRLRAGPGSCGGAPRGRNGGRQPAGACRSVIGHVELAEVGVAAAAAANNFGRLPGGGRSSARQRGRIHMMDVTVQDVGVDWHHPSNVYLAAQGQTATNPARSSCAGGAV